MKAIAAVNELGYIGKDGDLLYNIKEDLAFFAGTTKGKTLIMGKNTLLSLPGGKGLKGRTNLVLSGSLTKEEAQERGVIVCKNLAELFDAIKTVGAKDEDLFVIGGSSVYSLLLPYCDTLLITRVFAKDVGDVKFPDIPSDFVLTEGELCHSGSLSYRFDTYVRN